MLGTHVAKLREAELDLRSPDWGQGTALWACRPWPDVLFYSGCRGCCREGAAGESVTSQGFKRVCVSDVQMCTGRHWEPENCAPWGPNSDGECPSHEGLVSQLRRAGTSAVKDCTPEVKVGTPAVRVCTLAVRVCTLAVKVCTQLGRFAPSCAGLAPMLHALLCEGTLGLCNAVSPLLAVRPNCIGYKGPGSRRKKGLAASDSPPAPDIRCCFTCFPEAVAKSNVQIFDLAESGALHPHPEQQQQPGRASPQGSRGLLLQAQRPQYQLLFHMSPAPQCWCILHLPSCMSSLFQEGRASQDGSLD